MSKISPEGLRNVREIAQKLSELNKSREDATVAAYRSFFEIVSSQPGSLGIVREFDVHDLSAVVYFEMGWLGIGSVNKKYFTQVTLDESQGTHQLATLVITDSSDNKTTLRLSLDSSNPAVHKIIVKKPNTYEISAYGVTNKEEYDDLTRINELSLVLLACQIAALYMRP